MTCDYCGAPTKGTKYCPGEAHKNKAWSIRRKFSGYQEQGKIKARHMKLIVDAIEAEEDAARSPCTAQEAPLNMRGLLTPPPYAGGR